MTTSRLASCSAPAAGVRSRPGAVLQRRRRRLPATIVHSAAALHTDEQLPWDVARQLAGLEVAVAAALQQASSSISPGPAALEALAQLELARSNLLRPAAYWADTFAGQPQQAAAAAVQQQVLQLAEPVFASRPLLQLLLRSADAALQQLAAAAAAAAAAGAVDQQVLVLMDDQGQPRSFVAVTAGLAVAPGAAAAAAERAAAACSQLEQAATKPRQLQAAAAVRAAQAALTAVDAALSATVPAGLIEQGGSDATVGEAALHRLLLCRQLLATWLPPLAAAAAQPSAPEPALAPASRHGTATAEQPGSRSTRRLLQSALVTLAAVSNSSSSNSSSTTAPLLLMTEAQAAVLQPLLLAAGLDDSSSSGHQQQRAGTAQRSCVWVALQPSPAAAPEGQPAAQPAGLPCMMPGPHADELSLQLSAPLQVHEGSGGLLQWGGWFSATEDAQQLLDEWQLQRQAQKHASNSSSSSSSSNSSSSSVVHIPLRAPLRLLRASVDVVQVLLRRHPDSDVRRQLYASGLLPLLQLQQRVLDSLCMLRQQLAEQQGAASYAQLVLAGSCLGAPKVAVALLQQLQPVVREVAAAELGELQQLAARMARARGRVQQQQQLQPWDVAFSATQLVQQRFPDLDWGRDVAPYFSLPGLLGRLDQLLATACGGLRLLPASDAGLLAALAAAAQQGSAVVAPWGTHVMHLVLLDGPAAQPQQPQQLVVLGHVFIELVVAGGFPFCSLLQLPHFSGSSSCSSAAVAPGSVVVRLPVPSGQQWAAAAAGSSEPPAPLLLPGPEALQALLHELGHAVSYLCPFGALQQQLLQARQASSGGAHQQGGSGDGSSSNSSARPPASAPAAAAAAAQHGWLFEPGPLGVHSLCLLAGPAPGLDMRELSSHLLESWCRDPRSLRALSCHQRLAVPLPQRTALQLPALMAATASAAAGGPAAKLHATLLDALHDLALHGSSSCRDAITASLLRGQEGEAAAASTEAVVAALRQHALPSGAALLDSLDDAAAAGPVGGAKAAYVMARLLAAAAWTECSLGGSSGGGGGGARVKRELLCSGAFAPGHHVLMRLLGRRRAAHVLTPVFARDDDDEGGGGEAVLGWAPNLAHSAFQDLDLL